MIKVKPLKYNFSFWDRLFLPALVKGLLVTFRHLFMRRFTVQYPEEKWIPRPGYRGGHRLNRDEFGRPKCVACELCATACPAECIHIVPGAAPWDDRERYPVKFEIDELRCIFCGMCEEACPEDAIELTEIFDFSAHTREALIWDKERLLKNFDLTADGKYYQRQLQTKKDYESMLRELST